MNKKILFSLIAVIALFVISTKINLFDSEKENIEKVLNDIKNSVSFKESLKPLSVVKRIKFVETQLDAQLQSKLIRQDHKELSTSGLADLKSLGFAYSKKIKSHEINRNLTSITVDGNQATAEIVIASRGSYNSKIKFNYSANIEVKLNKDSGEWIVYSVIVTVNP